MTIPRPEKKMLTLTLKYLLLSTPSVTLNVLSSPTVETKVAGHTDIRGHIGPNTFGAFGSQSYLDFKMLFTYHYLFCIFVFFARPPGTSALFFDEKCDVPAHRWDGDRTADLNHTINFSSFRHLNSGLEIKISFNDDI